MNMNKPPMWVATLGVGGRALLAMRGVICLEDACGLVGHWVGQDWLPPSDHMGTAVNRHHGSGTGQSSVLLAYGWKLDLPPPSFRAHKTWGS